MRLSELFTTVRPTRTVLEGFESYFGTPLEEAKVEVCKEEVCQYIENAFDQLLRLVAMVFSSSQCDVILLSGRPSSLPPIRQTLLEYYPVTPNRLILLNNYYVWATGIHLAIIPASSPTPRRCDGGCGVAW